MAKIPGIADVHIHQITDYADASRRRGPHHGVGAGADAAERDRQRAGVAQLHQQVTPNYWVNPENRVNYVLAVQTPPDRIATVDALMNTPIINGIVASASRRRRRPTWPRSSRRPDPACRATDRGAAASSSPSC